MKNVSHHCLLPCYSNQWQTFFGTESETVTSHLIRNIFIPHLHIQLPFTASYSLKRLAQIQLVPLQLKDRHHQNILHHCLPLCYSNQCCCEAFFEMESETVTCHLIRSIFIPLLHIQLLHTHLSAWHKYGWFLHNHKTDAKYLVYELNAWCDESFIQDFKLALRLIRHH